LIVFVPVLSSMTTRLPQNGFAQATALASGAPDLI
jgi:hypothetical protein